MEARGHRIVAEDRGTFAVVFDMKSTFDIMEKSTRTFHQEEGRSWQRQELTLNGKLCFRHDQFIWRKEWVDTKTLIETKIPRIIAYLEVKAIEEIEWRRKSEESKRKREEEERIKRELKERKEKELNDFKELFTLSNRYKKSNDLRNYIETIKSHTLKNGSISEELQIWIDWANKKADWFDPFIDAPDEYLDDFDKNEIDI
jgi:hypothetical protein